jgi:integral membrane sensor domain MASE1
VVAIIAGLSVIVGIGLHFGARYLTQGRPRSFIASKTVLMILLLAVVVLGLIYDPYWATTFLLLPALIWGVVGRGHRAAARIVGGVAIVAAGFILYAQAALYERSLGAGLGMIWYTVLGLSNGMLHWKGYFLAACAIVLGLRFLSLQLFSPEPRD